MVSLVVGMMATAVLIPVAAESKPKHPEWAPIKTECRGNGAGGYRACRVYVSGRVDKVVYDLFINGKYEVGIIYQPERNGMQGKIMERYGK